jgi:GDP-D-mannose dehydratase
MLFNFSLHFYLIFSFAFEKTLHEPEYCKGMWRTLQHDVADDFVLATDQHVM